VSDLKPDFSSVDRLETGQANVPIDDARFERPPGKKWGSKGSPRDFAASNDTRARSPLTSPGGGGHLFQQLVDDDIKHPKRLTKIAYAPIAHAARAIDSDGGR
jgi:hypothetical protein